LERLPVHSFRLPLVNLKESALTCNGRLNLLGPGTALGRRNNFLRRPRPPATGAYPGNLDRGYLRPEQKNELHAEEPTASVRPDREVHQDVSQWPVGEVSSPHFQTLSSGLSRFQFPQHPLTQTRINLQRSTRAAMTNRPFTEVMNPEDSPSD